MNTPTDQNNPYAVATAKPDPRAETLASLLKQGSYRQRFEQVLGQRAPQFISSILSLGATMKDVEPKSVLAAACIAASLDLPIDKNLGFAWIVPYKKDGRKLAQFQLGSRGVIQLAQRTGTYARMNAEAINAEAYKGRDEIGEPVIDWDAIDVEKPVEGYVFAFKLVNGFTKVCYWSKAKVENHAKQYSQSFRGGYDSPWKSHFDQMALKTVVANELRRWGLLSVEMQGAFAQDHGIKRDIDATVEFPETGDEISRPKFDAQLTNGTTSPPSDAAAEAAAGLATADPKPRGRKPKEPALQAPGTSALAGSEGGQTTPAAAAPSQEPAARVEETVAQETIRILSDEYKIPFDDCRDFLKTEALIEDVDSIGSYGEVPAEVWAKLRANTRLTARLLKTFGTMPK